MVRRYRSADISKRINKEREDKDYMEIVSLILNIVVIVLIFLVGLFTKNYLQSYMDKKEKI